MAIASTHYYVCVCRSKNKIPAVRSIVENNAATSDWMRFFCKTRKFILQNLFQAFSLELSTLSVSPVFYV